MKNLLATMFLSFIVLIGLSAQNKERLFIDTDKFTLNSTTNTLVPGSSNYNTIEQFKKVSKVDVRLELIKNKYKEDRILASDRSDVITAYRVSTYNGELIRNENGNVSMENKMEIGVNTNAVISGEMIYSENRKVDIIMKFYIRKDELDYLKTDVPVFIAEEINSVSVSKSTNFLEEEERAKKLARRMTRKLLGKGYLTKTQEYVVTGSGLILTGVGTALFLNSNSRYQIYKDKPYELDLVYNNFKNEENPRQAHYEALKRTERLSYVTGGLGIALTTFGAYEIILDKKRSKRIYDALNSSLITNNTSESQHTLTVSSDFNYNPITAQTSPQLKLKYRF